MSIPAFYLAPEFWGKTPCLSCEEAHHAHVLRLKAGDEIMLLDGVGGCAICRISQMSRSRVELEYIRRWAEDAPLSKAIVALALSKAVRRGFFLEKASELGAWEIWLWQGKRSQGKLDKKIADTCAAQLRAGAKQCHNPWFPKLRICKNAEAVAKDAQDVQWRIFPWECKADEPVISADRLARPGVTIFAIGPEGGVATEEAQVFIDAGFEPASLGSRVLRCETAAVLCLGLHWWASQKSTTEGVIL